MPRSLRLYEYKTVYFLTCRVAEGLPFVPNCYINALIKGILAKASCKYPSITINAWIFLSNHYHGVVTTEDDPSQMEGFLGYVNGEIAKIICRMLGKRNVKIWAQRPHVVPMLTPETVIDKIAYLYLNAPKANLCGRSGNWFGVSTWSQFMGAEEEVCEWIRPSQVNYLPSKRFTRQQLRALMDELAELNNPTFKLRVSPSSWTKCFEETRDMTPEQEKAAILSIINKEESQIFADRAANKKHVADRETLKFQNPHKYYRPKKFSKRSLCISRCEEARALFIAKYQAFYEACRYAWDCWKEGKFHIKYPPGAFIPTRPPLASIVPGIG